MMADDPKDKPPPTLRLVSLSRKRAEQERDGSLWTVRDLFERVAEELAPGGGEHGATAAIVILRVPNPPGSRCKKRTLYFAAVEDATEALGMISSAESMINNPRPTDAID